MRLFSKKYLVISVFGIIAAPIYAAHTDSAPWDATQPMMIGDAQVKPGNYELKASEFDDEIDIIKDGKVVATALCYWIPLQEKAASTEVKVNKGEVTEVEFKGRPDAVVFFTQ